MNKEKILLDVLNEYGNFTNLKQQFDEDELVCIFEAMDIYKGQPSLISSVNNCTHCYGTGKDHGDESMETECLSCK